MDFFLVIVVVVGDEKISKNEKESKIQRNLQKTWEREHWWHFKWIRWITKQFSEWRDNCNTVNSTFDPSSLCLKQTICSMWINLTESTTEETKKHTHETQNKRNMSMAQSYLMQCKSLYCLIRWGCHFFWVRALFFSFLSLLWENNSLEMISGNENKIYSK